MRYALLVIESVAVWNGTEIQVRAEEACRDHELEVVHHYDERGCHYCPTGCLCCPLCAGVAYEPEPLSCMRWSR